MASLKPKANGSSNGTSDVMERSTPGDKNFQEEENNSKTC